jgi:hypothetical protein
MKVITRILLSTFVAAGLLSACGLPAGTDNTATINTAVAGTQQPQALAQATVNSSVLTSMPATPTAGPPVEYVSMTEEELTALIDQAVTEAVSATEQTTSAVTSTTSDEAVTSDEVTYVYDYYYYADYYVQYAEQLLNEYYELYGELASQMISELGGIQGELSQMNDTLTQIAASLDEISASLEQGLAVAEETISQLESAAQGAQANAQELKAQAQDMLSTLEADQQNRLSELAQIQPSDIPSDRLTALQTGFDFIDSARNAMGDNKLTHEELMGLAQLGANAQAGFISFGASGGPAGGPDLSQFTSQFGEITQEFARGQMPQARGQLDNFERSLGSRPSLPGGGGGPRPPGGPRP